MTDYNNGAWHFWGGGECPVHPETIVEVQWQFKRTEEIAASIANAWQGCRDDDGDMIFAFRVIEPYQKPVGPRAFWVNQYPKYKSRFTESLSIHETKEEADQRAAPDRLHCIKVVEVTEK